MGFFNVPLERNLLLEPKWFGPKMREVLHERLRAEVEGTCSGRYGFVVLVTSITDVGEGVIQDTSAHAKFTVSYDALVFRPFKGEVLDCVITSVNKARFPDPALVATSCPAQPGQPQAAWLLLTPLARRWASSQRRGRCRCLCQTTCVPAPSLKTPRGPHSSAFAAHSGGLDLQRRGRAVLRVRGRDGASPGCPALAGAHYFRVGPQVRIQKDSEVRLRIVGTRNDANEIFCVGTIKDDFLGLISAS